MENLYLTDFNDLFVIAVGISMTYIVVGERLQGSSFFKILSQITTFVKDKALSRKTKPQQKEESVISRIDFYLNSQLLNPETRGALMLISQKAKDVMMKIKALEDWSNKKLEFHTKTDFLSIISYDCFLFGLFVIFVGAFQFKKVFFPDGLIGIILLSLAGLLLHCLIFEHIEIKGWKNIFKPTKFLHSLILIFALIIGIYHLNISILLNSGWIAVLSVVGCFAGFIAYFFMNLCANVILLMIILVKIYMLNISSKAKIHNDDIDRFKEELDAIDSQLKQENLAEGISATADDTSTYE